MGLTSRYNWAYFQSRVLTEHAFAIKIGLTQEEISRLTDYSPDPTIIEYARKERGYWLNVNMPDILDPASYQVNEQIHGLVSNMFRQLSRRLGFFVRADRSYGPRIQQYDRNLLFVYKRRLEPAYFNNISYQSSTMQYEDMYDFLMEQSYHYVYDMGQHSLDLKSGVPSGEPVDPLLQYNNLLSQLFPGYSFVATKADDLTLRVQLPTGDIIPFQDMSSGEKETFFLLSFFIRNDVSSSIIVVDEPELHLHPDLARKLVTRMRTIRPGNQTWLATHSAELIDEAGRDRTFYLRRSEDLKYAECIPATAEGAELQSLRDLFGISGYVGIASKVVFSEGTLSSADRKTFVNLFPELARDIKLIPSGSVSNLHRINQAILALLESDFARCRFYLIRDRDYLSIEGVESHRASNSGRLFVLSRYHIENYLLDEAVIADVLNTLYGRHISKEEVRGQLFEIARTHSAEFLRDLVVTRFAELYQPEDCSIGNHSQNQAVINRNQQIREDVVTTLREVLLAKLANINLAISQRTAHDNAERVFQKCLQEVETALQGEGWKSLFPGRTILQKFSIDNKLGDWPVLQNLVIERMAKGDCYIDPELRNIFTSSFR